MEFSFNTPIESGGDSLYFRGARDGFLLLSEKISVHPNSYPFARNLETTEIGQETSLAVRRGMVVH